MRKKEEVRVRTARMALEEILRASGRTAASVSREAGMSDRYMSAYLSLSGPTDVTVARLRRMAAPLGYEVCLVPRDGHGPRYVLDE